MKCVLKRTSPVVLGRGRSIQTQDTQANQGIAVGGVQLQHPLKGSASPVKLAQLEEADAQAQANLCRGFRVVLQGFAVSTAARLPLMPSVYSTPSTSFPLIHSNIHFPLNKTCA